MGTSTTTKERKMNEDTAYDDEMNQIQQEIQEECQEYGENMQRSEDEGWFYSDEDGDQL
jgi:hypothetical protein